MYGFLKLMGLLASMALAGTAHAQVSLSAETSAPTGAPGTTISTLAEVAAAGGAMMVWPFPKDLFEREPAQKYISAPGSVAVRNRHVWRGHFSQFRRRRVPRAG